MTLSRDDVINYLESIRNVEDVIKVDNILDQFFYGDLNAAHNSITHSSPSLYSTLSIEAFSTSYIDYYNLLKLIPSNETLIDLGAGYSRGSFISSFVGNSNCYGIEMSYERVEFTNKRLEHFSFSNTTVCADLENINIPKAYAYYLYFPRNKAFYNILKQLISKNHPKDFYIFVCESHGDVIPFLRSLDHFKEVFHVDTMMERHFDKIVQFKINRVKRKNCFKTNFINWHFEHMNDTDIVLLVEDRQLLLNRNVKYLIQITDSEISFYNNSYFIEVKSSGKLFSLKCDKEFTRKDKLPKNVIDKINQKSSVFLDKEIFYCSSDKLSKIISD